jgi:hypothetical protein
MGNTTDTSHRQTPLLSSDGLCLGIPNHGVFHSHEPKGRQIRNQRGERGHEKRFSVLAYRSRTPCHMNKSKLHWEILFSSEHGDTSTSS